MRPDVSAHDALARLLEYPQPGFAEDAPAWAAAVAAAVPDAAPHLEALVQCATSEPVADGEERYTRTFDVNPTCALEVGWQLFGEQYARGAFLVKLRQLARDHGVPETPELPDFLPQVLRVLARMDPDPAAISAHSSVLPAVQKMRAAFDESDSPYRGVLDAVIRLLECYPTPVAAAAAEEGPHE